MRLGKALLFRQVLLFLKWNGRSRLQGNYFIAKRIQTVADPEPYGGRRRGL